MAIDEERCKLIDHIRGWRNWLGWGDIFFSEWLMERFGVESSAQLSIEQLREAIAELHQEAPREMILRLGNLHPSWGNPHMASLFSQAAKIFFGADNPLEILASAESAQDIMYMVWGKISRSLKRYMGFRKHELDPEEFVDILRFIIIRTRRSRRRRYGGS